VYYRGSLGVIRRVWLILKSVCGLGRRWVVRQFLGGILGCIIGFFGVCKELGSKGRSMGYRGSVGSTWVVLVFYEEKGVL
jgi:hypothetical protein